MSKPTIPMLTDPEPNMALFSRAVKSTLDSMTGKERGMAPIAPLDSGATLSDVIAKVNEILGRLQ